MISNLKDNTLQTQFDKYVVIFSFFLLCYLLYFRNKIMTNKMNNFIFYLTFSSISCLILNIITRKVFFLKNVVHTILWTTLFVTVFFSQNLYLLIISIIILLFCFYFWIVYNKCPLGKNDLVKQTLQKSNPSTQKLIIFMVKTIRPLSYIIFFYLISKIYMLKKSN